MHLIKHICYSTFGTTQNNVFGHTKHCIELLNKIYLILIK